MGSFLRSRIAVAAAAVGTATLVSSGVAVSGASGRPAARAATPPKLVRATRITRRPGTLAPGTGVRAARLDGQRVFVDPKHGVALASAGGADYAVATTDGAKTWKTDGPALHLHAAQAPLAVLYIGAVNRETVFAWGGGQVIDATRDGGRSWYGALFSAGTPVAVVPDLAGHLLAFIGSVTGVSTWQYVSKDGGRTWRYQTTVNG
jgi:hypothetical protein